MKKIFSFSMILILSILLSQLADAQNWKFHQTLKKGKVTIYWTKNCEQVGVPIYDHNLDSCKSVNGGVAGGGNNDLMVINKGDTIIYTCHNMAAWKGAAPQFDQGSNRWRMQPLLTWVADLPTAGITVPSLFDSTVNNQNVYMVVDLVQWFSNPRPIQNVYTVTNGICPDLPGYLIGTTPIVFDSLAGPQSNPFSTTPLTGTLIRGGELTFKPQPYPTLTEWGLIILALLIISTAVWILMRRRARLSV